MTSTSKRSQGFENYSIDCNKTDSLNRYGLTAGNPPQPCFICKFCGKTYNTHNVVELVENASKAS
ncbi:hypothetical protein RO3G_06773 [Rhizopus delemar RA 99-880]|uniref:Uncharacterized protein n=1 Tax=Rhizopus delemar (strain RA 99-880 / ATCC MYA-4621 / FGSC 9543 / NRRL 43880) TaxID=246409 RepID=I1C0T8_RHIO9|nr:hypothetical protein RO3G_06773 [Rhizopus delemar RA 99-880]|eukprot:EIE82068.1 hypothetical protein RO3G_06773 [Rhizopus delemar RA 99-880]